MSTEAAIDRKRNRVRDTHWTVAVIDCDRSSDKNYSERKRKKQMEGSNGARYNQVQ